MPDVNETLQRRLAAIKAAKPVALVPEPRKADSAEFRESERTPSYRFGRLILADRAELRCIIRDISPNGVRIVLEGAFALSERVILKVDQTGERRRARVAWQRDRDAGLSFAVETPVEFRKQRARSRA